MELNKDRLSAMRTAFNLKFQNAFSAVPTVYDKFSMVEGDAAHTTIDFPFLETFAFLREWIGPRQIKNLTSRVLRMTEKAYEDTVAVKVRDIETDNWKQYASLIAQMGQAGAQLWDRLAIEALTNPKAWIDNKAFFGEHKYGKQTIANAVSTALNETTFDAAFLTMCSYQGHNGEALGVRPDTLMHGPSLSATAWNIVKNSKVVVTEGTAAIDNRNFNKVELLENPRLVGDYANDWYLMQANGVIKPVILQKSKDVELVPLDKPDHENVFDRDEILYGSKAYGSAAAAFPHLVYRGGRG